MSEIKYWAPVQNAWNRMVTVLFRPFDFGKWMVIGFAAFLAQCGRGSGGGNSGNFGNGSSSDCHSREEVTNGLVELRDAIIDAWFAYTGWIIFGVCFLLILMVLISVLVNWLNSRGQFMFLDNVLKNRGAVQKPWREYSREANSLLVFQFLFNWISGLFSLLLIAGILVPLFMMIVADRFIASHAGAIAASILLLIISGAVCGFVKMTLSHFVVPLMYQRRLTVLDGFRAFTPVFKKNFWRLVLFGLIMIVLNAAIAAALFIGILLTCCTALIVLVIPYIGTVAVLPIFVFRRFIGPEFLRQFGDEYDLITDVDELTSMVGPETEADSLK